MKEIKFEKRGKIVEIKIVGEYAYAICDNISVRCYPQKIENQWVYNIHAKEKIFRALFGHIVPKDNLCLAHNSAEETRNILLENTTLRIEKEIREENDSWSETENIDLIFKEGEILSGYIATNQSANTMLLKIGVAERIAGWGTRINDEVIKALGTSFTYKEAKSYMSDKTKEKQEQVEEQKLKEEQAKLEKFKQAKLENKPVLLESYLTNCNDDREECSIDIISIYAMPDGSINKKREHTW